jgi:hypothetical protein
VTLVAACLAVIVGFYFALFPRVPAGLKRDDNVACIGEKPAFRVLAFTSSPDATGQLRYQSASRTALPAFSKERS